MSLNLMTGLKYAKSAFAQGTAALFGGHEVPDSELFSKIAETSLPQGVLDFQHRYGKTPDVSQMALVKKYWGWNSACIHISATRFSSTPMRLYSSKSTGQSNVSNFPTKRVDKDRSRWIHSQLDKSLPNVAHAEEFEEIEEHPLLDLLTKPNDYDSGWELKELTQSMLDLTGNAYWMLERDKLGVPSRIFLLRSQWVRIIPDKDNFIEGFWYGYNNAWGTDTRLELMPEQVIWFKYPSPVDPWYGMGPTQMAAYALESEEMREKWINATLNNMARPDMVIKYLEGELDPQERMAVEREWNSLFKGSKNAGKVKVTDFRWEMEKIGWSPNEMDFNQGEEWIVKKIASVYPVPLGLLDTSQISRAPKAGMEGVDMFLAAYNTLPRCTRFEEKVNSALCPLYDERLFVAFDNPMHEDESAQNAEDDMRLKNQSITINEIRKRNGEDPVEWGDKPLVPSNIVTLGEALASSPGFGQDEGKPTPNDGTNPDEERSSGVASGDEEATDGGQQAPTDKEEKILKALKAQNVEMEVEGEYIHPTLAGVPVKIRVRNESGRFDRHSPEKIRGDRETFRLLMGKVAKKGADDSEGPGVPGDVRGQLRSEYKHDSKQ